jgi:hypothetical protein
MGAHPYWYFVEYQTNVQAALDGLRKREFKAGRYNPVMPFPEFPIGPRAAAPGAQHSSIDEAMEEADADGTRSILDIHAVAEAPDFCVAAPLSANELEAHYGTDQPTREMIENDMEIFQDIERGHCLYTPVYKEGKPSELFFAGYSFD